MELHSILMESIAFVNDGVLKLGGDKHSAQERARLKRIKYENNPALVSSAETVVDAIIAMIREQIEVTPELTVPLFASFRNKLMPNVKEERDMFLDGIDGTFTNTANVDPAEVAKHKLKAEKIFATLLVLDEDITGIPLVVDKVQHRS